MPDKRSTRLRWLLGAVLCVGGAVDAGATIILPPNQTPVTAPAGVASVIDACRWSHSSSKKKNDFDVIIDWGDATSDGPFHPNKTGKQSYVARRTHTYAACGVYTISCDIFYTKNGFEEQVLDVENTATVSGTASAPTMTISVACPAIGTTGMTASVPAGATDYVWSILDADGNDLDLLITAGQTTEAITFDAASAGTTMFVSLNETASDNCPAATSTRRVQVDFTDVGPSHPQHDEICVVANRQVSRGCGNGAFCPDSPVTRAQLALLALKGKHADDATPFEPAEGTGVFNDVPASHDFVDWIEAAAGVGEAWTAACDLNNNFCPDDAVTRAQAARFALLAEHGAGYVPPAADGAEFTDVQPGDFAADFIEQFHAEMTANSFTVGCGGGQYCPSSPLTRAHVARFLIGLFLINGL